MPGLTGSVGDPPVLDDAVVRAVLPIGLAREDNTCPGRRLVSDPRLLSIELTLIDRETRDSVRFIALWVPVMNPLVSDVVEGSPLGLKISRVSSLSMTNLFKLTLNIAIGHVS